MLGKQAEAHLLHIQCRKCQHSVLAFVVVNQMGASSVGLLTDLSYEDVLRFRANHPVSIDDVMAVHELFNANQWEKALGRTFQKKVHTVLRKREKKEQKNRASR